MIAITGGWVVVLTCLGFFAFGLVVECVHFFLERKQNVEA